MKGNKRRDLGESTGEGDLGEIEGVKLWLDV